MRAYRFPSRPPSDFQEDPQDLPADMNQESMLRVKALAEVVSLGQGRHVADGTIDQARILAEGQQYS